MWQKIQRLVFSDAKNHNINFSDAKNSDAKNSGKFSLPYDKRQFKMAC